MRKKGLVHIGGYFEKALKDDLTRLAKEEGISRSNLIGQILRAAVNSYSYKPAVLQAADADIAKKLRRDQEDRSVLKSISSGEDLAGTGYTSQKPESPEVASQSPSQARESAPKLGSPKGSGLVYRKHKRKSSSRKS